MGVLIPLITSSILAYDKRQREAEKVPREKFLDQLEKAAAFGETAIFNDPKTWKAAEKYGVEPVANILQHIVNSDMTAEDRAARVAGLRSQRAQGEAGEAAGQTETQRQRSVMQPAITGIAKGQQQRQQVDPMSGGLPTDAAELQVATTPTKMPSQAGQVQAQVRGQDVEATTARRGQDVQERVAGERTRLGYYEVTSANERAVNEIEQRTRELDERKRTTVSATDKLKLDKDSQALERDRIKVTREAVENDKRRTTHMERESKMKFVEMLVGEGATVGKSAKAARELVSFFDGKTENVSPETEEIAGLGTKRLTALRGVYEEARKMEKDANKMIDDVIGHQLTPSAKKARALKPEEIDSRLEQANEALYKAIAYKAANRLITQEEAAQELMASMRVLTDTGEILSPKIAMGLGKKFNTAMPAGVQKFMGQSGGLSKDEQGIVDRFTGGTPAIQK